MPNNKLPGNDEITKEFCEAFWDELKTPFLLSINKAFKVGGFNTSQKRAFIKLIVKKDKDKRLIKNWRPISVLGFKGFSRASKNYASFPNICKSNSTSKQQVY